MNDSTNVSEVFDPTAPAATPPMSHEDEAAAKAEIKDGGSVADNPLTAERVEEAIAEMLGTPRPDAQAEEDLFGDDSPDQGSIDDAGDGDDSWDQSPDADAIHDLEDEQTGDGVGDYSDAESDEDAADLLDDDSDLGPTDEETDDFDDGGEDALPADPAADPFTEDPIGSPAR